MKRKCLLIICVLLIACIVLVACNKQTDDNKNDKKTWPSVSYLTEAEKYNGVGEITHTTSFADDSNGVYINSANEDSVSAYRTQLENAGWTLSVGPVSNADNTAWGYTKGAETCSIRLYSTVQTEERSSGNFSFNLYIGFENDDGILPPAGDGDDDNPSSGTNPGGVSVSDVAYQLGNHYYISSRWDVTGFDNNDNEYVYQEYRKVALIGGVYFIEKYDFNYEKSNAQGNFSQVFYVPNGSEYKKLSRNDTNEAFELRNTDTLSVEVSPAVTLALGETAIMQANTYIISSTLQYVTAGATSTHEATGRTVKKYTYGASGTPMYDFYVDTQTKVCLKFDDHINDGHINLSIFSTSGNAWGSNGLPALPNDATPEPTALTAPVVTINQSGLASWTAVSNANGYKVKVNGGTEEIAVGLSEQLTDGDTIQVKAVGNGTTYSDSAFSVIQTYTAQGAPQPTALVAPTVSINESGLASWTAVTNASGYKYKINNGVETATDNLSVQLTDGQSIVVKAVGNGTTYSDSVYSASETYTEIVATHTWPVSAKLTEYGFDGLTQPTGSTITIVGETAATEDEPSTLTIMISNGTGEMFDNLTTSLFTLGAINGINEVTGTAFEADSKSDLMNLEFANGSAFMGLKATATTGIYDAVIVEYYSSASLDEGGNPIAAQTFIISFAKIDLSSSSSSEPSFADYITLPQKFTLTYSSADGETRTIVKDGDKLWYHVHSEYEDRESLAIKQSDDTYNTYEKDNKISTGRWGTDPMTDTITYSDDVFAALGGFEMNLLAYAQCKVNGDVFETGAATTVADMTCNVYTKESSGYTDTYYTYNGLTFKYTERYAQDEPTVYLNVLTYSATGDLSDSNYSID